MPTPQNTSSALNRGNGKSNYDVISYGNRHGRITFGQIHRPGDVTAAVMLETADGKHRFFMDADGPRKGGQHQLIQRSSKFNVANGQTLLIQMRRKH